MEKVNLQSLIINRPSLIIIAGPTAVGKTSVAIQIAKHFDTEIISADSRQIFKELNIGVARPSVEELAEVKHHFIANKSISTYFSAGEYDREVIALLDDLFKTKNVVILCGGTGFYINAILNGFDEIPPIEEKIREALNQQFKDFGIEPLQQQLKELDEETYNEIDIQNPQRVIRALEVCIGTNEKFSSFKRKNDIQRNFTPIKIGLNISKEQLHHNINSRVDEMMRQGLLEEAKSVINYRNHNALQTVGYKELFDFMDSKTTLKEAVDLIKLHTRQYAKRQLTFFNKHNDYNWFQPKEIKSIINFVDEVIK
ncbi:MAG TPA: tRNA (adenosine(37)-N6)-dimethylallyltransferase MiaA [Chitinophagales bacterium]|nr:tRNA (adenosine(37)-N6)-dimethylallyltransferase MiaA [Chitinophagales bacterium]